MRKVMVDQTEIKDALRSGMKAYTISKRLDIPISVVNDVKAGKSRLSFFRKPIKDKNKLCTCCGFRKKMPGARYLCFVYFAEHSQDTGIDEYCIST